MADQPVEPADPEAEGAALRERIRVLEKALRKAEKNNRRFKHTARINSQIGERNKTMMFRAHEALTHEIAKQKETEHRLREAMARAEEATHAKSAFLANMSHELRTPMNGVMGMLELAMAGPLTAEQSEYLRTARSSAQDLLILLNDILDLSKIEAGHLALEAIPFSPWDAVDEVCAVLVPDALDKGVSVHLRIAPRVPAQVRGDPVRYRQILKNLLSNAIKFTAAGAIVVSLSWSEQTLTTSVSDTGIGISPTRLAAIFQPFSQADVSTTRKFGGTGLGLTIARHLTQLMHGELTARSTLGEGSTFAFTARLEALRHAHPPELPKVPIGLQVNEAERAHLTHLLRTLGLHPGPLSLSHPQRIVLIDEHTDTATAHALRARGSTVLRLCDPSGAPPAPAQSLRRPLRRRLLAEKLRPFMGRAQPARKRPDQAAPPSRSVRILVAEDHPVNQLLTRRFIEECGQSCTVVADGQAAVDAVRQAPFDVVFMDCNMPTMDGYTATARIRALTLAHQPFIVALTASAMAGDRERCLAAGMDSYLSKPVSLQSIAKVLGELCKNSSVA